MACWYGPATWSLATMMAIFGDTPKSERDRIIARFKRGEIRALAQDDSGDLLPEEVRDYYQAPAWTRPPYPLPFDLPVSFVDSFEVDWKDPEPRTLIETEEALQKLVEMALTPPRYINIPQPDPDSVRDALAKLRASDIWVIPEEPEFGTFEVTDLTPHQEVLREYVKRVNEASERVASRVARKAARFSVDIVGVTTDLDDVEEDWGPTTRARLQEFFTNRG